MSDPKKERDTGAGEGRQEPHPGEGLPHSEPPTVAPLQTGEEALTQVLPDSASATEPQGVGVLVAGQVLAGRYSLLGMLGRGGMGEVHAAYDAKLDRRVALKLLQGQGEPGVDAQTRLLREAQAMARLSHPNVVAVYDAGALEDGALFIAMEMVEGQTLRQWARGGQRSWREVLQAFLAAGRGLAAAHVAGVVHRDFKPDNVLVGRDGRVRVTDFGLARMGQGTPSSISLPSSDMWEQHLTLPGMVLGTPKYMAPELLQGHPADERSDLFAFCVALYEALYHQPPFPGANIKERVAAQREGRVVPPPARSEVPAWVARAVLQGLRPAPEQRPASMEALLEALSRSPAQARMRLLAMGAAALGLLGLAGGLASAWRLHSAERAQLCQGGEQRLASVWDGPVQQQVLRAFSATGAAYAQDVWGSVQVHLEGYTRGWVAMHRESCEATRLRGEQSEAVMTLRMACLDRHLQQLGALVEVLSHADTAVVQRAVQAAQGLPSLQACADVQALLSEVPPPDSPSQREAVEALRRELHRIYALSLGGQYTKALEKAERAVEEARSLGYPPLVAEALLSRGLASSQSDPRRASQDLSETVWMALAQRQDRLATEASVKLLQVLAVSGQHELLDWWKAAPLTLLARTGGTPMHESKVHVALAISASERGHHDFSLESFERARELAERLPAQDGMYKASVQANTSLALLKMGRYRRAMLLAEGALESMRQQLGSRHPHLAITSLTLAQSQRALGRYAEARRAIAAAQGILAESSPPGSWPVALASSLVALVALDQGNYEEARVQAQAALEIFTSKGGRDTADGLASRDMLSAALIRQGEYRQAQAVLDEALEAGRRTLGEEHPVVTSLWGEQASLYEARGQWAKALVLRQRVLDILVREEGEESFHAALERLQVARSLIGVGRAQEALELARRAQPSLERSVGEQGPAVAAALQLQGEALLALKQPAEAASLLAPALRFAESLGGDPNVTARRRLLLARALSEAGQSPELVARLLAQAEQDHARTPFPERAQQAELARLKRLRATGRARTSAERSTR